VGIAHKEKDTITWKINIGKSFVGVGRATLMIDQALQKFRRHCDFRVITLFDIECPGVRIPESE